MRYHDVWGVMDNWQHWTILGLAVATVFQTGFVLVYSARPWFRDIVGRAYMLKSSTLLVILWLSVTNTFFTYPLQEQISTFAMWAVAAAITYQFAVLVVTPRRIMVPQEQDTDDDEEDSWGPYV